MKKLILTFLTLPLLVAIAWLASPFIFSLMYRPEPDLLPAVEEAAAYFRLFCRPYAVAMAILVYCVWGVLSDRGAWRNEFFDRSPAMPGQERPFLISFAFYLLDILARFLVAPVLFVFLCAAIYWNYSLFASAGWPIPGLLGLGEDAAAHEVALQKGTFVTAGILLFSRLVIGYLGRSSRVVRG